MDLTLDRPLAIYVGYVRLNVVGFDPDAREIKCTGDISLYFECCVEFIVRGVLIATVVTPTRTVKAALIRVNNATNKSYESFWIGLQVVTVVDVVPRVEL